MKEIGSFSKALRRLVSGLGLRDQNIVRATYEKAEEVHGERKDMVERKRGQHMIAFPHIVAAETKELRHVRDQIAVRQHRPLAHPRGATRILQTRGG